MKKALQQVEAMRNPMAAALAHGTSRQQVVRSKKGRGSFTRKPKHRSRIFD